MTNPVYVVGDENGNVINVSSNNPNFGWIIVRQDNMAIVNGWLQNKSVSAIIMGSVDNLERANYAPGQVLEGKIVVKEQLEPFSSPDRDLKIAGATGIVCSVEGKPIYRKTEYVTNMNITDVFVQHDNTEEIKSANSKPAFQVTSTVSTLEEAENVFEL